MTTEPQGKSALRGIWTAIFFAAPAMLLSGATEEFWGENNGLKWLFQNYGIYAGVAGLILFVTVVADRVKKGERINVNPALVVSIIALIITILGLLIPASVRDQWYQSIIGAAH